MLPEAVRRHRFYAPVARWRGRRALQRTLKRLGLQKAFDPEFKRRYMSGERFAPTEVEEHYDRIWEAFSDDCVRGDDLETIIGALHEDARTVVDVGCGGGRVAVAVAGTGRTVTGTDISGAALKVAEAAAIEAGVSVDWVRAPLEALPFADGAFDAVLCSHTLEHVQDLPRAVAELRRVASKQLIVIVPREDALNELSTDYHFQTFPDPETLAAAIGLPDYECYVARTENDQWQGEYVFFAAAV